MFSTTLKPLGIYQRLVSDGPRKWVLYFLITNIALLTIASTLVGMILYGKIFVFSLVFWFILWSVLVFLGWYIKGLISNYLLRVTGKEAHLLDTLLPYGLAYGANIPVIIIYIVADLLVEVLPGGRTIISLVVITGFISYVWTAAYGLRERYKLTSRFSVTVALISLAPEFFSIFLLKN